MKGILKNQAAWSQRTFGPGLRTKGILNHIRKELDEVAKDPLNVEEWVDIITLAFDGALRTGATVEEVLAVYACKQEKNQARTWPDWRNFSEDEAIEHDRSAG